MAKWIDSDPRRINDYHRPESLSLEQRERSGSKERQPEKRNEYMRQVSNLINDPLLEKPYSRSNTSIIIAQNKHHTLEELIERICESFKKELLAGVWLDVDKRELRQRETEVLEIASFKGEFSSIAEIKGKCLDEAKFKVGRRTAEVEDYGNDRKSLIKCFTDAFNPFETPSNELTMIQNKKFPHEKRITDIDTKLEEISAQNANFVEKNSLDAMKVVIVNIKSDLEKKFDDYELKLAEIDDRSGGIMEKEDVRRIKYEDQFRSLQESVDNLKNGIYGDQGQSNSQLACDFNIGILPAVKRSQETIEDITVTIKNLEQRVDDFPKKLKTGIGSTQRDLSNFKEKSLGMIADISTELDRAKGKLKVVQHNLEENEKNTPKSMMNVTMRRETDVDLISMNERTNRRLDEHDNKIKRLEKIMLQSNRPITTKLHQTVSGLSRIKEISPKLVLDIDGLEVDENYSPKQLGNRPPQSGTRPVPKSFIMGHDISSAFHERIEAISIAIESLEGRMTDITAGGLLGSSANHPQKGIKTQSSAKAEEMETFIERTITKLQEELLNIRNSIARLSTRAEETEKALRNLQDSNVGAAKMTDLDSLFEEIEKKIERQTAWILDGQIKVKSRQCRNDDQT